MRLRLTPLSFHNQFSMIIFNLINCTCCANLGRNLNQEEKLTGSSLAFCLLKTLIQKTRQKINAQYCNDSPAVELSQTVKDFQQQQTGRLL